MGRVIAWELFETGACAAITFVYINGEHLYFVIENEGAGLRVTAWQSDPRWTVIGPLFGTDNGGNLPTIIRSPNEASDFIRPGRKYGFS